MVAYSQVATCIMYMDKIYDFAQVSKYGNKFLSEKREEFYFFFICVISYLNLGKFRALGGST